MSIKIAISRTMWALHNIAALPPKELLKALDDRDQHVRAWAIQFLCEDHSPSPGVLDRFVELARSDRSPVVRLYLAAALQRIDVASRWATAAELVRHGEDADDHNIPKMIWFGIEPAVPHYPARAVELAITSQIPLVTRFIARRLADADQLEPVVQSLGKAFESRRELLLGIRDALAERFDAEAPPSWNRVYRLLDSGTVDEVRVAREIAQQFGDIEAAAEMLATLQNDGESIEVRHAAIRGLSRRKHPQLKPLLATLLDDQRLRRAAIQAMASYDDARLAEKILTRYPNFTVEEKLDVIHTLASRDDFGQLLTDAIASGDILKRDVPAYVARLLRRVVGPRFVDVWGPIDELSADQQAYFASYRDVLTLKALKEADRRHGRELFRQTCLACHKMQGEGGEIGPDLTGANRTNREYLLGNILTPSAVIQDAYRMQLVLTEDGRVYSGILAGENEHQLQLRIVGTDEPIVIAKSTIESREVAPVSMMPEGLLKNLTDAEVLNLFAYLMFN